MTRYKLEIEVELKDSICCNECQFVDCYNRLCTVTGEDTWFRLDNRGDIKFIRPDTCPLKLVGLMPDTGC
jgi:hypothetical protein